MKSVIFDFDGTIADSLPVVIDMFYEITKRPVRFTDEEIQALRNMPAQQIIRELKVPMYRIPRLMMVGRQIFKKKLDDVRPFQGIGVSLQQLHEKGFELYVMSSNSAANIELFLRHYDLMQYFTRVYGNVSIFGKAPMLRKIIKRHHLDKGSVIYVGDETRDIEGAHKVGIPVASVVWGYNGETILRQYRPDYLAHTPEELLKTLLAWSTEA